MGDSYVSSTWELDSLRFDRGDSCTMAVLVYLDFCVHGFRRIDVIYLQAATAYGQKTADDRRQSAKSKLRNYPKFMSHPCFQIRTPPTVLAIELMPIHPVHKHLMDRHLKHHSLKL